MAMIHYSYPQICHILEAQDLHLEKIWRYKERTAHYNIRNNTGDIIASNVTLNWIRCRFTELGYPLDFDPIPPRLNRYYKNKK